MARHWACAATIRPSSSSTWQEWASPASRPSTHYAHRFHINPEASDLVSIVCFVTVGDTPATIDRLVCAFETLSRENRRRLPIVTNLRSSGSIIRPGIQVDDAARCVLRPSRAVPLREAAGESVPI